jgi:multiple sugar transport system substrate-binding protein
MLLTTAGCSRSNDLDRRTVVRFSFWGNFRDFALWREMQTAFEKANPDVRLKLEYISGNYHQKLPLQLISKTAADVILMDDEIYPAYAIRGYLEDLKPYMERDAKELGVDKFLPTAMESFTYRDFIGGLPWDGNSVLIFLNTDLFAKAGVPLPDKNWTYDDLRRISKQLTKDLDGDGRPDQFGSNLFYGFMPVEPVVWSFGGDMLNADRTACSLDRPEAMAALQFIYDLKWKDHSTAQLGELQDIGDEVSLLTGRVAMVLAGSYVMATLKSAKDAMHWDVTVPPAGPNGLRYTRVTWDGISLNKNTSPEKKAAGWRFIKFLLSEEGQAMVGRSGRAFPVRRDYAEKYFVDPKSEAREEVALEATEYGRLTPMTPKFLELFNTVGSDLSALQFGSKTPAQVVAVLKPKVDKILSQGVKRWGPNTKKP